MVFYNEFDKNAAAWLRELIDMGLIAEGRVDERSITEVEANDIGRSNRVHWFAGIGGWDYALQLAGWPADRPVWTASLPCQPFSLAGKGLGKNDERHLLPHFLELVRACKPDIIFGEQVDGAIRHGWLDDLQTTMEKEGYAVGHCVLGAHSVGAPHIRQRLYWVGIANSFGRESRSKTTKTTRHRNTVNAASWDDIDWLYCRDGKYRPIKSGIKPLVNGIPRGMVPNGDSSIAPNETAEARAMRLKGYGNAIVPQVAAEFIRSAMESGI